MKTLRLLLFDKCNRRCPKCCNKTFDTKNLPIVKSYKGYEEIILTGGEPMLYPGYVLNTILSIRNQNPTAKIIMYTAKTDDPFMLSIVLAKLDGITITIHDDNDVDSFLQFNAGTRIVNKSLRLNIFKCIDFETRFLNNWSIKENIEWLDDCPLPENEVFMRLDNV